MNGGEKIKSRNIAMLFFNKKKCMKNIKRVLLIAYRVYNILL